MQTELILRVAREGLLLVLLLSAPALLASLVIGLLVALLQAVTQVQDATLTFAPKLVVVFAVLAALAPWIGAELVRFGQAVMALLPHVAQGG